MKYIPEKEKDGWTRWIFPNRDNYKLCCCDCGLVHVLQFRLVKSRNRIEFRASRDNRATAAIRRKK